MHKLFPDFHCDIQFDSDNLDHQNNETNKNFEPSLKKQKNRQHALTAGYYNNEEKDVQIYEFVPFEETEIENIATHDILSIPDQEFDYQSKRCPPTGLQKPINPKLLPKIEASSASKTVNTSAGGTNKNKIPRSDRRRPVGGLRALTSSDVGEKYNILLDNRLVLVEKQLEQIIESKTFAQEEHRQKIKILRLEEENLRLEKEEKLLKVELLKSKIQLERI
ncbi:unnamed protein product [Brassicogethes aeneus]|uniref:Uncharacterized protein n=1 Tax=Brassicogethes aeneus TaxID=1431903 RepID=A0A9P0B692_BRAAE|nr:unnamed protein product [Brassicogethes aeneus]